MKKVEKVLTFAILILAPSAYLLHAQEPADNQKFSITLSGSSVKFAPGKDIWIKIQMTNLSEQTIDCSSWVEDNSVNRSFRYDIRDQQERSPEKVAPSSYPEIGITGSKYPCELGPGKSRSWDVAINRAYRFDPNRDYTIQVSRIATGNIHDDLIKSNFITITVLPEPEAAEPQ